jgi:hypothetical protein
LASRETVEADAGGLGCWAAGAAFSVAFMVRNLTASRWCSCRIPRYGSALHPIRLVANRAYGLESCASVVTRWWLSLSRKLPSGIHP